MFASLSRRWRSTPLVYFPARLQHPRLLIGDIGTGHQIRKKNPRQPSQRGFPKFTMSLGKGWLSGQRLQKRSAFRCS
ncbi:hypothetical protein OHAE_2586 [Ochrobactrum soli]|uniref:Uncharacterized protein n=1 Tax=Ochrobactrum soli TaxID=2448455 RepID=A0A2P9HRK6_9HYPH|nr:hypothetical protein OHAE_2586 [[Ochrobactrum] soli]